jgi:hypothetical protein
MRRGNSRDWLPRRTLRCVEAIAHCFAGLEVGRVLLADVDAGAGEWVTAGASITPFDRERTEATQFYSIAASQRCADLAENPIDNDFSIARREMRFGLG